MTVQQARVDLRETLQRAAREVAFNIHAKIVQRTPIDTGRAKASWRLNEDVADATVEPQLINDVNPSTGSIIALAGPGEHPFYSDQAAAVARAQQQKISSNAERIVISNNLHYIEKLENGASRQAPAGMVAVTVTQDAVEWMFKDALNQPF